MKKVRSILLAIPSILGSCQPAMVVASPSTAPATTTAVKTAPATTAASTPAASTPLAASQPACFLIGTGSPSTGAVYTSSPAPATVNVDGLNLLAQPTDWLAEQFTWDFGDPSGAGATDPRNGKRVNLDTSIPGPVAAYEYEHPGTYQIRLNRILATGQTLTYTQQVIVPPSARTVYYIAPDGNDTNPGTDRNHPLRSATAAIQLVADHTEFRFRRGSVYTFEPEFAVKHRDILIDAYGESDGPLPILRRTPATGGKNPPLPEDCVIFATWPGQTADVTIRNIRIDSPWTPAATAGGYAYHAPAATFGTVRGSNVTIADCEFDNLVEGPHGDPTASGLLFLRNRQVDPLGIPSRTLWLEGHHVVAIGNIGVNSVNESPFRAASTGIVNGLIAYNAAAQQLDANHGRATAKAASTLRTMADVTIVDNQITNAEFSFDPRLANALDQRILVANNVVINSQIDIKTNVRHAIFRGNSIVRDGGPCITINPGSNEPAQWIDDLQLINNTGQGWLDNGRMLQINPYGNNQLRGFVFEPARNVYTRVAPPVSATQPATRPG